MTINIDEAIWLKKNFPDLQINSFTPLRISGNFIFSASFDSTRKVYIVNPESGDGNKIEDSYQIEIDSSEVDFPKVTEVGGKIQLFAQNLGLPTIDLHLTNKNYTCLIGQFDRYKRYTLEEFMLGPLLQFFYDQSFHNKFGTWPRGEYSHNAAGLFENYHTIRDGNSDINFFAQCLDYLKVNYPDIYIEIVTKKSPIKGHHLCICGSKKMFRNCHTDAFKGLWQFKSDFMAYKKSLQ